MARRSPKRGGAGRGRAARSGRPAEVLESVDFAMSVRQLVPGGAGLGQSPEGLATFIEGAFPGDQVRVHSVARKKSFLRAASYSLVRESMLREKPACSYQRGCGGCDWMELSREAQLREKARIVHSALVRTGGFAEAELEKFAPEESGYLLPVSAGTDALGYRNRIRLSILEGRLGYRKARSHALVEIGECLVARPLLNAALAQLKPLLKEHAQEFSACYEVEIFDRGEGVHFHFYAAAGAELGEMQALLSAGGYAFSFAGQARRQHRWQSEAGLSYWPEGGFVQVNAALNLRLLQRVQEEAAGHQRFLDLFCGNGNFSLPLARAGLSGVGVEYDSAATEAGQRMADEQGLDLRLIAGDAKERLMQLAAAGERFDLALLDPPRAGAKEVLPDLIALCPRTVLSIGCDPVTFARDLRTFCEQGYRLEKIEAFDFFPQTHHIESFAVLKKND